MTSDKDSKVREVFPSGTKILVGVDGSPNSAAALAFAVTEAAAHDTTVEAIYVWQTPGMAYSAPRYAPPSWEAIEAEGYRIIDDALEEIDTGDVKVSPRVIEGSPAPALAAVAAEPDVRTVVVGARGRGAFGGFRLGSVGHALTHHCPKPLVVVPAGWARSGAEDLATTIVVGVDGSSGAEEALRWAVNEAAARGGAVEAVIAWTMPATLRTFHRPIGAASADEGAADARGVLDEALARVGTGDVQIDRVVEHGHAERVLADRSRAGQMLVVGRRGLGRAQEAVLGSVSHACTHDPAVPVAVIPLADRPAD